MCLLAMNIFNDNNFYPIESRDFPEQYSQELWVFYINTSEHMTTYGWSFGVTELSRIIASFIIHIDYKFENKSSISKNDFFKIVSYFTATIKGVYKHKHKKIDGWNTNDLNSACVDLKKILIEFEGVYLPFCFIDKPFHTATLDKYDFMSISNVQGSLMYTFIFDKFPNELKFYDFFMYSTEEVKKLLSE